MIPHRAATFAPTHAGSARAPSPRLLKPDFREGSYIEERDKTGRLGGRFRCGRLLGRGGFAKCYEFTDQESNVTYACKVIDRASLQKSKTLQKLHSEIAIHKRMKHKNIVNFIKTFQDDWFVYILLEKCHNETLMEVSKTRPRFSVAETQHIMLQSIAAIQYMHENGVIHRDLKLGNMMMDSDMNVKIGDFGLAAELAYDGERKRTICGTPNYIAPEILEGARDGHSFEVDVWSLGVILYTLLVGEPPFQTKDVKATYQRIKQCRYDFPPSLSISECGKDLVHRILQSKPDRRPTLIEIRGHAFFRSPTPPTTAPLTLFPEHLRRRMEREGLTTAPKPDSAREALKPLWGANMQPSNPVPSSAMPVPTPTPTPLSSAGATRRESVPVLATGMIPRDTVNSARGSRPPSAISTVPSAPTVGGWCAAAPNPEAAVKNSPRASAPKKFCDDEEERNHLTALHDRLHQTINGELHADAEDGTSLAPPSVWVTDYADFSAKYGLTYKLSTGHTGVHFNDSTKMVWEPVTGRAEYYARIKETINGVVHAQDQRQSFLMDTFPEALNKKVTLIKYFKSYLAKSRSSGVEVVKCSPYTTTAPTLLSEPHMVSDMIYVKRWLITPQAMIFRLSNKSIQVCFRDHAEVILSSESKVVTFTDAQGRRKTILLSSVASQSDEIATRLKYTKDILCKLISNREL